LVACRDNDIDAVELLMQERKLEYIFEKDGWSPILWAACNGNEDIVRLLVK